MLHEKFPVLASTMFRDIPDDIISLEKNIPSLGYHGRHPWFFCHHYTYYYYVRDRRVEKWNQVSEGEKHQSTARWYGQEIILLHGAQYQDDYWCNATTNKIDHGRNSEEAWGTNE